MLILLLITLILFFVFSFWTLGKDFCQPSCLVILSYIVCTLCALMMQSYWQYTYHFKTMGIILLGLLIIYLANLFFYKYRITVFKKSSNENATLTVTNVPNIIYILLLGVQIVAVVLYYLEILRIVGGGVNISAIMTVFRAETSYDTEESVSFVASQFLNVSFAISLISLYVFLKITLIEGVKRNVKFLVPVILYIFNSLMTGGRFSSLIVITAGITMFAILYRKRFKRGFSWKVWFWLVGIVLLALAGFYLIRELIGRTSTAAKESSFIEYICNYMGGSLPLFDMYLQDPIEKSAIWGKETFFALNNQFIEWGLIDAEPYITHLEFRSYNGYSLGNIYTGFRRNLQDFGFFEMLLLQFIFSAIMSGAYNKVKRSGSEYGTIVYCSIAYVLYLHGQNDYFYIRVLSLGTLIITLLLYFVYAYAVKKRIGRVRLFGGVERELIWGHK